MNIASIWRSMFVITCPVLVRRLAIASIAISLLVISVSTTYAANGINGTVNFQGKLVNTDGTNVTDGNYSVVFTLYDDPTAGSNLWDETQTVTVSDGVFRVALGSVDTSISAVNFNSDQLYLGVKVGADAEMTPRIRFTAVPYAFNASKVNGLTVTNTSDAPFASTTTLKLLDGSTVTFEGSFTKDGADALTITTTGVTSATLPVGTITLVDLAASQELTNKTIGSTGLIFSGATTDIDTAAAEGLTLQGRAASVFQTTAGAITLQPAGTGTTSTVQIGAGGAGSTTPDFFGLDVKSDTGDPAGGFEGAMYYNTSDNKFRCYQNTDWTDCITSSGAAVWSDLTAPSGNLALNMSTYTTDLAWSTGTSTNNLFSLATASDSNGTGALLRLDAPGTANSVSPLRITTNGAEALTVSAAGNVGIGTTITNSKLHVQNGGITQDWLSGGSETLATVGSHYVSGFYEAVKVVGKYAYVASGAQGLRIIDISDPTNPTQVGQYNTYRANQIDVVGKYAYIAAKDTGNTQGFYVLDISNPASPVLEDNITFADEANSVKVSGKYAYVTADTDGLNIVDISNPANLVLVGNYPSSDQSRGVEVIGTTAYVTDNQAGLRIIDVSNPANPVQRGLYNSSGSVQEVHISGRYAFLADSGGGLVTVDISDITSPQLVSAYTTGILSVEDVKVAGNYAYIADNTNGIKILDISNPASPQLVASAAIPDTAGTSQPAEKLFISGNYFYGAFKGDGLHIYNLYGAAFATAQIGTLSLNSFNVADNAWISGGLNVNGGIQAGPGGVHSQGVVGSTGLDVSGAKAGLALAMLNELGDQDVLTASVAGTTVFSITNAGGLRLGTDEGDSGECMKSQGAGVAAVWGTCGSGGGGTTDNGSGLTYVTSTGNDFAIGGSDTSAEFYFDIDGGASNALLYIGVNESKDGGLTFYSSGAGVTDPRIYTDSSGNLTLVAEHSGASVVVGDGSGNIELSLSQAADGLISHKTLSLAANYSGNDFTFRRTMTGTTYTQNGALVYITDTSSGSNTINPDMFTVNADLSSGTFTGNLLRLQVSDTDVLVVNSNGGLTLSGTEALTLSGTARRTKSITLSAEYQGAVFTGDGSNNTGTMTSDVSADNAKMTYYEWNGTTGSGTDDDYEIVVRFRLPDDFNAWDTTGVVFNFATESTNSGLNQIDYSIYESGNGTADVTDNDNVSAVAATWTTSSPTNPSVCATAGDVCVINIKMFSEDSNYVRVGDIKLNYRASY